MITDCLSAIAFTSQSVRASRDNIVQHKEIRQSLSILAKAGLTIAIAWVPSHSKHRDWQAPLGFRHVAFRSANKVVDDRCTAVRKGAPLKARNDWWLKWQAKAKWSSCALQLASKACLEYEKWFCETYVGAPPCSHVHTVSESAIDVPAPAGDISAPSEPSNVEEGALVDPADEVILETVELDYEGEEEVARDFFGDDSSC